MCKVSLETRVSRQNQENEGLDSPTTEVSKEILVPRAILRL